METSIVEHLVVGYALAAHGHPRSTEDIAVWLGREPSHIGRLTTALTAFGFGGIGLAAPTSRRPRP